jgi:hypothetical protein
MALPVVGTVTVASGVNVTWAGAVLSPGNIRPGYLVTIDGQASHVLSVTDTTHFVLQTEVSDGSGLECSISQMTPENMEIATLNAHVAKVTEDMSVLNANASGLFYYLIGETGENDPNPTFMAFNAPLATPDDITKVYLDVLDANNLDVSGIIKLFKANDVLVVRSLNNTSRAYISLKLMDVPDDQGPGEWFILDVEAIDDGSDGLLAEGESVSIEWNRAGTDASLGNPKGGYNGGTTYTYRDIVTNSEAMWLYHSNVDGAGTAPPTLPTTYNTKWQQVTGFPSVEDVLEELGITGITYSASPASGPAPDGHLWLQY